MDEVRRLTMDTIDPALLKGFVRTQRVQTRLRRGAEGWYAEDAPFTDDWSEAERVALTGVLRRTLAEGGAAWGAFECGQLKGFAAVEGEPIGTGRDMLALSELHVSADARGRGIGRGLFEVAAAWARAAGARKLYISAHSAVESQRFYAAVGCAEAEEYDPLHVALEPFDCQLEYRLLDDAAYDGLSLPSPLAAAGLWEASATVPAQKP